MVGSFHTFKIFKQIFAKRINKRNRFHHYVWCILFYEACFSIQPKSTTQKCNKNILFEKLNVSVQMIRCNCNYFGSFWIIF